MAPGPSGRCLGWAALAAAILAAAPPEDPLAVADGRKREAIAILKGLEARRATPKEKIEESQKAISALEEAKKVLDSLPPAKAGDAAGEVNALLFWARKMMPIAAEPPKTPPKEPPPVAKEPPPVSKGPPKEPPPVAKEPPPADPRASEKEAEVCLADATRYGERHPDDPFMLAVRFMEVAGRFQGTKASLEAQRKAFDYQQKMMEEILALREEARRPPPPADPPDPGAEPPAAEAPEPLPLVEGVSEPFDTIQGIAGLYKQPNKRLHTDFYYLWAQVRFLRGDKPAKPSGCVLKTFHEKRTKDGGKIQLGASTNELPESAWTETEHDPFWGYLSYQPVADAPNLAKKGYKKKPVHLYKGILFAFTSCINKVDPAGVDDWFVRLEVWDKEASRKLAESPPLKVKGYETTQPKDEDLLPGVRPAPAPPAGPAPGPADGPAPSAPAVTEVKGASGRSYELDRLEEGKPFFSDRKDRSAIAEVPDALAGAVWIRTPNEDKEASGDAALKFRLARRSRVYVGLDADKAASPPPWLAGFGRHDLRIVYKWYDGDSRAVLFSKVFEAGDVALGGNLQGGGKPARNYTVLVVPED